MVLAELHNLWFLFYKVLIQNIFPFLDSCESPMRCWLWIFFKDYWVITGLKKHFNIYIFRFRLYTFHWQLCLIIGASQIPQIPLFHCFSCPTLWSHWLVSAMKICSLPQMGSVFSSLMCVPYQAPCTWFQSDFPCLMIMFCKTKITRYTYRWLWVLTLPLRAGSLVGLRKKQEKNLRVRVKLIGRTVECNGYPR